MVELSSNSRFSFFQSQPTKKIFFTVFLLFLFRFGNTIPLSGIDQEALKKSFLQLETGNSILQMLSMYAGGSGKTLLSPFSLGIIPFINASILVDLLTTFLPSLEKLQSEEGEAGRKTLFFYKKIVTFVFGLIQSATLLISLKSYIYLPDNFHLAFLTLQLTAGSFLIVWFTTLIDTKGIGNGTSLIIFTNIVVTLLGRNFSFSTNPAFLVEFGFLLFLTLLICLSQLVRLTIQVVSARQLAFLENFDKSKLSTNSSLSMKESGLSIRLNQAGIFPIIIASNLVPFLSYFLGGNKEGSLFNFLSEKGLFNLFYYLLIVVFNYFYTTLFWDPEKIADQLRKASVSIVNVTPGKETVVYLERVVRTSSLVGGFLLCGILASYELAKSIFQGALLQQINVSSLIILVGIAYEIQKNVKAMYRNLPDTSLQK
jgi:preprotein translocase subunit SecY